MKQALKDLKRDLKRAARSTRKARGNTSDAGSGINVAHRTNIVVAANVGEDKSVKSASASQVAPITQARDQKYQK